MNHHHIEAIKGVIFDLDGTLVTSELDFAMIKAQLGCPSDVDLLEFIDQLPSPYMREEALNIVQQHELLDAKHAAYLPGVAQAINTLHKKNIPMAIVSRNFEQAATLKLKNNPLPIDLVLTRDDGPCKPDPTGLTQIAKLWNLNSNNVIYVGDYLYDIQAAHNANMRACLYVPEQAPPFASEAEYVVHHMSELVTLIDSYAERKELC